MDDDVAPSAQAFFADAIVVSAQWESFAGFGTCELALTSRSGITEVWRWDEDGQSVESMDLGELPSWREAVERLAGNEELMTPICAFSADIHGSPRYIGRLLAMAWGCDSEENDVARALARLPDATLEALDHQGLGLFSHDVLSAVSIPLSRLRAAGLDLDDLPSRLDLEAGSSADLRVALEAEVDSVT